MVTFQFAVCLTLALTSYWWGETLSTRNEEDDRHVLELMRTTFQNIRIRNQYGALYVPPPNAPRRQLSLYPSGPTSLQRTTERNVIHPAVTSDNIDLYPHTYVAAAVDINGEQYRDIMERCGTFNIHTEDLLLNLVYDRGLSNWYWENYDRSPPVIYIYTYFLPCERCFAIIQNFVQRVRCGNTRVYVGFSQMYGGSREGGNTTRQAQTRMRFRGLETFMTNNNGQLFHLSDTCPQGGRRARRDVGDCSTNLHFFVIGMNFVTGKAEAWFSGLVSDNSGWIEILNDADTSQTYEYTHGRTEGNLTFSSRHSYMYTGTYLTYHYGSSEVVSTYSWNNCGFQPSLLNDLPYPTDTYISIEMTNGQATVLITQSSQYTPNSNDYVAFQSLEQLAGEEYITYAWVVRSFTTDSNNSNMKRYSFSLNAQTGNGFRAKYVYYQAGFGYQWRGIYDNATPLWSPAECQGGSP